MAGVLHGSFTRQFYTAVLHGSFTRQFYTAVLHGSFTRQFYTAVLHGSARTTPRIRAELQTPQEATRVLAARYGLNPKTVQKWRKRTTTADQPMGPKRPRSTVLTEAEEAIVVEFRRRTLLPLDDVLGCLRESIPKLTRSALHRCLV